MRYVNFIRYVILFPLSKEIPDQNNFTNKIHGVDRKNCIHFGQTQHDNSKSSFDGRFVGEANLFRINLWLVESGF